MRPHQLADRIEKLEALDPLAGKLGSAVQRVVPRGPVKDLLSGTHLGHPLHPLLTDLPIGAFASAALLDLAGRPEAAETLLGVGVVTALPAAAAGLADWSDTSGGERRVGVVHAAANVTATALFAGSWLLRKAGRRGTGRALGLLGLGALSAGGFLGGHLSYSRAVGVNHALEQGPDEWTAAAAEEDLAAGGPVVADVGGNPALLVRAEDGRVVAIGARCSHAGGPLGEGKIEGGCVQCPWHGSIFRLDDGEVVHGPATSPQPAYETSMAEGHIAVRRA